ncbi:MAG TPA: hypothetical protein VL625_03420 [Patescibacteria group bacterium]|nr:hypothetical protein [Patescibacteria group bacterium]
MSEEEKQTKTSTAVNVIHGTVTAMKVTDNAALGMGSIETVLPGISKAAATTISESAPIIGPIAGKTVGFLARWGGRVAVPLQIVVGGGSAIYHGVKGQYEDMGGDIGGTVGGIGGGIAVGAAIGSIVPGVGTVIGGAIGGVIGYFGGEKAGRAIARHYVERNAEEKAAAERDEAERKAETVKHTAAVASIFGTYANPTATIAKPATPPKTAAPQNAFTKVTETKSDQPAVTDQAETPVTTPVSLQTTTDTDESKKPERAENSLGTLLDKSAGMHGSELTNVFQRVSKFADDNHLSLGTKFSFASMFLSVLNVINFGGWANSMIEGLQHFALDAMKGDLINQGPNLAGSDDTRPHQQAASSPTLVLAQQPT